MIKTALPIGFALWASVATVATFGWFAARERPGSDPSTKVRTITSDMIAVAVSGPEGMHYLTFKLDYAPVPGERTVPLETAAKDLLIEAVHRSPDLGRADRWRPALETVLQRGRERLAVSVLNVRGAQRRPAS